MKEILDRLYEQLNRLDQVKRWDSETLIDVRNKLNLYITKYFKDRGEYTDLLKDVSTSPQQDWEYDEAITKLKSIVTTLIEDINLGDNDISVVTEEERHRILAQARKEAELERERIQMEAKEIQKMREELQNDRERLLAEEEKFNFFKTKLEVADKEFDFQQQARNNKTTAYIWAVIAAILTGVLVYILFDSLKVSDTFIHIANQVKKELTGATPIDDHGIISKTIYFSFSKYIFTKLLLYSMLIYAIVFCVKNYNAQMHNNIINTHKSNAFRSTLSLLNTARSDEGNDKLLVQATQAIFSHQQTGYSGKDSEPTSPNVVTNVIDAAAKKI
jgi:hypothetical protein